MSYTLEKVSAYRSRMTFIENLDEHVKEYKYWKNVPKIQKYVDKTIEFLSLHEIPDDVVFIEDMEESKMTLNDIYVETHALDEIIRKLIATETRTTKLSLGKRTSSILNFIQKNILNAQYHRKMWESVKASDNLSDSTDSKFTGFMGAMWYDEPLKNFLESTVNSEFMRGDKYWKPTTMKELLRFMQEYYTDVEHITVGEGEVPKHILVALVQQLIVIEANRIVQGEGAETQFRKSERLNRATFKIHHGFQLDTNNIVKIFTKYGLMNCSYTKILDRSSTHMMKDPPQWVKNTISKDVERHSKDKVFKESMKGFIKARTELKKSYLKQSYGKRCDMNSIDQENMFVFQLDKYHANKYTRISLLNTAEYDKYYKRVALK